MEEDSFKMKLSNILDRIDDENADYVTRMLKTDIDAFIAEKISPEWRNIITVLLCVRRQYAVTYLDGIFDDFNAMKNFKPEYNAEDAEGIPMDEAAQLLQSVRTTTLRHFQNNLRNSTTAIKDSIVQRHPHLSKPDMAVLLDDIVTASRRAFYYKELKATVCGSTVTGTWKYENTLRLEVRMLSGVDSDKQQRNDSLRRAFVDTFTKSMMSCETKLKCMWCFRLESDARSTKLPSHYTAYNLMALQQQCGTPMYIIIHAQAGYDVSDLILAFMLNEQQNGKEWVKLLPSGVAAVKAKGITLHFFLRIDQYQANIDEDSEEALRLQTVTGIILDEFLMNNVRAFRVLQDTCQLVPLPPERRKKKAFPEFGYRDILLIKDMVQTAPADRHAPIVTDTFIYWPGTQKAKNLPSNENLLNAICGRNSWLNQNEVHKYITKCEKKKQPLHWCRKKDAKRNKWVSASVDKDFPPYNGDTSKQRLCVNCAQSNESKKKKEKKRHCISNCSKATPRQLLPISISSKLLTAKRCQGKPYAKTHWEKQIPFMLGYC